MRLNFFPRSIDFDTLFREQNAKLREAAELLSALLADFTGVPEKCQRLYALEADANELSRTIATSLASTFITALDREDIHALNTAQETAVNLVRAIASRVGLYGVGEIRPTARELVDDLRLMTGQTGEMLRLMHAKKPVDEASSEVRRLKARTDSLLILGLTEIYEGGIASATDVVRLLKWSQIYDRIEEAIGQVEQVASVIEGISLKNA
jgi:uncharacterized protein Yka (UPF0111/DUF47 family)